MDLINVSFTFGQLSRSKKNNFRSDSKSLLQNSDGKNHFFARILGRTWQYYNLFKRNQLRNRQNA